MSDRCQTAYPILLIHGIGFRDRKHLNYWGRIPKILEENGAKVYFGGQDSWGTIEHNALILKSALNRVLQETGAQKVNLIAHSKGGLEARYLISTLGLESKIASLTTIATPHHGSKTMKLLCALPNWLFEFAAVFINLWFRILGDKQPNFKAVCNQLTPEKMVEFNRENPDHPQIFYQSYMAVMKNPFSDILLSFPYLVILAVEGKNDGIVPIESAKWGEFQGVLKSATNRGISHADEVDIRRYNFSRKKSEEGVSDIREVYLSIVEKLKKAGY